MFPGQPEQVFVKKIVPRDYEGFNDDYLLDGQVPNGLCYTSFDPYDIQNAILEIDWSIVTQLRIFYQKNPDGNIFSITSEISSKLQRHMIRLAKSFTRGKVPL